MGEQHEVTQLLGAWEKGDQNALEQLVPLVERELKLIARNYMRKEDPGHTLQTTALVNEAFIKLMGQKRVHWNSRSHFFAIAAKSMRRILVDHAKGKKREKRGGDAQRVSMESVDVLSPERSKELIALDEALDKLAREVQPRAARVAEMRYFGGMTAKEIAQELGTSVSTVNRAWDFADVWLKKELRGKPD